MPQLACYNRQQLWYVACLWHQILDSRDCRGWQLSFCGIAVISSGYMRVPPASSKLVGSMQGQQPGHQCCCVRGRAGCQ